MGDFYQNGIITNFHNLKTRDLDELEKGIFHDTPNGIRIYPIDNYKAFHNAPNQNIGGSW